MLEGCQGEGTVVGLGGIGFWVEGLGRTARTGIHQGAAGGQRRAAKAGMSLSEFTALACPVCHLYENFLTRS